MTYKILMHGDIMIDDDLLHKGLYDTDRPVLREVATTIDSMMERGKRIRDMTGHRFLCDEYFENLKKCELRTVVVTMLPREGLK